MAERLAPQVQDFEPYYRAELMGVADRPVETGDGDGNRYAFQMSREGRMVPA